MVAFKSARRTTPGILGVFLALFGMTPALHGAEVSPPATGVLERFTECDVCPEMIVLPQGPFDMGATEAETRQSVARFHLVDEPPTTHRIEREGPRHTVTIDMPIAMARTEITRKQWNACIADGGCTEGRIDLHPNQYARCLDNRDCRLSIDDHLRFRIQNRAFAWGDGAPIVMANYHDIQEYIAWLNSKVGQKVYRLPTEAEWEFAARAGTTSAFPTGDLPTWDQANFALFGREIVNGLSQPREGMKSRLMPVPVDQLDATNDWGLRHMIGNVSELTRSCWSKRHLGFTTSSRHLAATFQPLGCKRIYKGGSYISHREFARPAARLSVHETSNHHWLGFRVVRDM